MQRNQASKYADDLSMCQRMMVVEKQLEWS